VTEGDVLRLTSAAIDSTIDQNALQNLRAFFAILKAWAEEDRASEAAVGDASRRRAARRIARHFAEDVESE